MVENVRLTDATPSWKYSTCQRGTKRIEVDPHERDRHCDSRRRRRDKMGRRERASGVGKDRIWVVNDRRDDML